MWENLRLFFRSSWDMCPGDSVIVRYSFLLNQVFWNLGLWSCAFTERKIDDDTWFILDSLNSWSRTSSFKSILFKRPSFFYDQKNWWHVSLMSIMLTILLGSHLSGFPLFQTDKIPWYFHDFSRFFSKFPGIFFIIFKVWFPSGFEYKYANLLSFIWTKINHFNYTPN